MKRPVDSRLATRRTAMLMALGGAAASRQAVGQSRSITIGYQEQPDWLMFVARDLKLFEKMGLSPSFVRFPGGTPMIEAAQEGSIDVASVGSVRLRLIAFLVLYSLLSGCKPAWVQLDRCGQSSSDPAI